MEHQICNLGTLTQQEIEERLLSGAIPYFIIENAVKEIKSATKRKRVVLNYSQRKQVWEMMRAGVPSKQIIAEFNIGQSTLKEIRKRIDENFDRYQAENWWNTEKKILKKSFFPSVDQALKVWYFQERAKASYLTQFDLQEKVSLIRMWFKRSKSFSELTFFFSKAKQFYEMMYTSTQARKPFQASLGYIGRFIHRNSIEFFKPSASVPEGIDTFSRKIKALMKKGYSPSQIYTVDQFGLSYMSLPESFNSPSAQQTNEERVTLMVCFNASADHKLPLVLINK
jgi:hypothetical protein